MHWDNFCQSRCQFTGFKSQDSAILEPEGGQPVRLLPDPRPPIYQHTEGERGDAGKGRREEMKT